MAASTSFLFSIVPPSHAWKNGPSATEFSTDPQEPEYGTHDWIAEHALDWLPINEKKYILDNLALYLYSTELPDKTSGPDAIGDMELQHVYFNESGIIKDNSSADRVYQEFKAAEEYFEEGDLENGILHLGIMTHYIADLAVFGNVMNETYWGAPINSTNYIEYVNSKMTSYTSSEFDSYLSHDGSLYSLGPYDSAVSLAFNTTFNIGGYKNCTWMDNNYNWVDPEFKDRCGDSLNYAVNLIADLLSGMFQNNITTPAAPQNLAVDTMGGHSTNLTWSGNLEKNLEGYSIYINQTDSTTLFRPIPINVSVDTTSYSYSNLDDETTYYFKINTYNKFGKVSPDSNTVHVTTLDMTPPQTPTVRDLPEFTNDPELAVSGISPEHGSLVEVYMNNEFSIPAGSAYSNEISGVYRIEITLIEGENNITVRAVDENNNPSLFAAFQIVILDIVKPVANVGENIYIELSKTPVTVQFDGSNSTDNMGSITNYTWLFDYQYQVIYLYGQTTSFTFAKPGHYYIALNVTDQVDNWALDHLWVNVTQLDIEPPYITVHEPEVDETNHSVNVTIKAKFNEALNISTINIKLISNIEGEIQLPTKPQYVPLGWLILEPYSNLTHSRTYTVIITATDLAGNPLTDGSWNFSTELRPEDFDKDEIPDSWEIKYSLDPEDPEDAYYDEDTDGLSNLEEYFGVDGKPGGGDSTDPTNPDTDGDGLPDKWELMYGLNPLMDTGDNGSDGDPDNDKKTNYEEFQEETDPTQPPVPKQKVKDTSDDDSVFIGIMVFVIIIVLLLLLIIVKKIRYRDTSPDAGEDDDYLKNENPDELGVGGNILFEDDNNFAIRDRTLKPEVERSMTVDRTAIRPNTAGKLDGGTHDKLTPGQILTRAKMDERKCPKCKAGLPKDTNYCFQCGEIFDK